MQVLKQFSERPYQTKLSSFSRVIFCGKAYRCPRKSNLKHFRILYLWHQQNINGHFERRINISLTFCAVNDRLKVLHIPVTRDVISAFFATTGQVLQCPKPNSPFQDCQNINFVTIWGFNIQNSENFRPIEIDFGHFHTVEVSDKHGNVVQMRSKCPNVVQVCSKYGPILI